MTTPGSGEGTPINDDSTPNAQGTGSGNGGFASPTGSGPSGSGLGSGAPQYGQYAPNGQQAPQYGQQAPQQSGQPQYGQQGPQYGQQSGQPPQFSQPQGSAPQYGQQSPQYGQQQPGQNQYGQNQFGQPQYGPPQNLGQQKFQGFAGNNKPGIIPLRPLGLGEIYDGMFGAIRRAPGVVLGLVSVVVAVFVAIAVVIGYVVAPWISSTGFGQLWNDEMGDLGEMSGFYSLGSYTIQLLVALIVPLATIFATAIVVVAIGQLIINRPVRAGDVWIKVSSRLLALLGVFFLVSILPALVYAVIVVLAIWLGSLVSNELAAGLGAIAFFGGLIYYIFLQTRWIFAPTVLILEERKVIDSIKRSSALVKGSFWRVVGYYLLTTIALSMIVGFVAGFAQSLLMIFAGDIDQGVWGLLGYALIQIATSTLTVGALAAVLTLLYVDIRMRKEALDLELIAAVDSAK